MADRDIPHVVILGGGFAGLYAARALKGAPVTVTLVDRRNFHLFQPLLYQVATAALSPGDISGPIRGILRRQKNVHPVWMAEVTGVDPAERVVHLADGSLTYDYLIVATGATHAYFGHPEWAEMAPGLKTVDDATEIRRRFLLAFEAAEREPDAEVRRRLLTFVIVGGGPTGVELAGTMAEIAHKALPREFDAIDTRMARIILLEGADRVLPPYPPELSEKARRQLERLGVEVRTSTLVTGITEDAVHVGEEAITAGNVFWAAGVAASAVGRTLGAPVDRAGRVIVGQDLTLPGHPEVFVVGDLAHAKQDGGLVPGLAPAAIQMGKYAGKTIRREIEGKAREPFHYRDKGSLAVIGRGAAVADLGKVRLSGTVAWLAWLFIHIMYLIGFRNRVIVLIQWAWNYVFFRQGTRLITGSQGLELARAMHGGPGIDCKLGGDQLPASAAPAAVWARRPAPAPAGAGPERAEGR
ncbi:MAG TPA: NAD(P)/FAD-dependent oxidoreductase [Longimicrobiales bacterium]|nr:NAD(P)/FAD-dependent oxidoreductase [Longimicrobiales bacterium]